MSGTEILLRDKDIVYIYSTFQNLTISNQDSLSDKTITEVNIHNNVEDASIVKLYGRQNTYLLSKCLKDLKNMGFQTAVLFTHGIVINEKFKSSIKSYSNTKTKWHVLGEANCPILIINLKKITDFELLDSDNINPAIQGKLLDQLYYNASINQLITKPIPISIKKTFDTYNKEKFLEEIKTTDVYLADTDGLIEPPRTNLNIETLICPASGINQFILAHYNMDTLKKVIWADFSSSSMDWIQYVLDNWNGKDYRQFVKDNLDFFSDYFISNLDFDYFDNMPELDWQKFKNLEHVFLCIDIMKDYDKIIDNTNKSNVLVNITNIFTYELNFIKHGANKVYISYIDYLDGLVKNNKNVYVRGKDPFGKAVKYKNVSKYGVL